MNLPHTYNCSQILSSHDADPLVRQARNTAFKGAREGTKEIGRALLSSYQPRLDLLKDRCRQLARPSNLFSVFTRVRRGRGTVAFADQVLISGSNFVANIVLVRALGLADFGKYFLAYVVILYANAVQMSFVTTPMLTVAPMLDGEQKHQFLRGMLAMQFIASFLLFVIGAAAGTVIHLYSSYYSLECIWAIACSIGAFQLQDWVRRYYFLVNRRHLAVVSDFISYFLQLVILAVLWRMGLLNLTRTFWVMCLTSAAASLTGPITDRIAPSFRGLKAAWAQCKGLSTDLLISNQVRWFGDQGILLIASAIVGPTGIGGLRATQSLAGPVTLILSSLDNVLPIKTAEILKVRGTAGAYAFTRKWIFLSSCVLGAFLIPVAIFGRPLIRLAYGPAVVAFYVPMLLQLVNIIVGIASRLWFYFFRGVRDTRAILRANMFCTLVSVSTVYFLGKFWNASGIVTASLLGQVAIVTYCGFHWMRYREELLVRYPAAKEHALAFGGEKIAVER